MKSFLIILLSVVVFSFYSCQESKVSQEAEPDSTNTETVETLEASDISDLSPQLPYELKDDGLYVYVDGPSIKEQLDKKCYRYLQKNYKYIRIESNKDKIISEEGPKRYQRCTVLKSCDDDLGKPSLFELGYERHKEREIKPEDNRYGKEKIVERKWFEKEKRIYEKVNYDYIPDEYFTQLTTKEFARNGMVISGKHISRVVIKTIEHLPKYGHKILVRYEKTRYNCDGDVIRKYILEPELIANFKRIDFKENIFEFVEEEPLPRDADYLSDAEFVKLLENIHQFIPRQNDRTIHKKHSFRPGYYLIEYYNGDMLLDYHCVKLGRPGHAPPLWDALSFDKPVAVNHEFADDKYVLVLAECHNISQAEHFIKKKDPYPLVILPFKKDGKFLVGRMYYNEKSAKKEMQRFVNMGIKKETMQILPFR
ncbi:hypothetical protein ACFLSQ_00455 [Bacteroidota bacterium]